MREFVKVMCVVVLMFGGVWAALVFSDDHPSSTTKILRYALPAVCAAAIVVFLAIHFRIDEIPDYLYELNGKYFDRDGFCFSLYPATEGANRRSPRKEMGPIQARLCQSRVAIRRHAGLSSKASNRNYHAVEAARSRTSAIRVDWAAGSRPECFARESRAGVNRDGRSSQEEIT
jgi:hypothetical protein